MEQRRRLPVDRNGLRFATGTLSSCRRSHRLFLQNDLPHERPRNGRHLPLSLSPSSSRATRSRAEPTRFSSSTVHRTATTWSTGSRPSASCPKAHSPAPNRRPTSRLVLTHKKRAADICSRPFLRPPVPRYVRAGLVWCAFADGAETGVMNDGVGSYPWITYSGYATMPCS